jgi:hypothetical protein
MSKTCSLASKLFPAIIFFTTILYLFPVNSQSITINEIMTSNRSTIADLDGDFPDWIELYNHGEDTVNLEGWGLSDDYNNPFRWIFPRAAIEPNGFLLVWASGKDRRPDQNMMAPGLMRDVYEGIPGVLVEDLVNHPTYPGEPTHSGIISDRFESPTNIGDNYGQRMHGWISPPSDGYYTFWIAGDDECQLFLSSGQNPSDITIIASVPVWTQPREWNKYPQQRSEEIYLKKGELYYIKALMKEGYGGDCLAVGWQLPDGTLDKPVSGEYLFWNENELHTNFSISSAGEEVLLTNPLGELVDEIPPRPLPGDISLGRYPDGSENLMYFNNPTPGKSNSTTGYTGLLEPPVFSHPAGFHEGPFYLNLSSTDPDVQVIYTLDGSRPDPDNLGGTTFGYKNSFPEGTHSQPGPMLYSTYRSFLFSEPLLITDRTDETEVLARMSSTYHSNPDYFPTDRIYKGNVVRAMAIKDGAMPSNPVTQTFFVTPALNDRFSLPVISLSIQPDHLFGYNNGIYTAGKVFDDWRATYPTRGANGGSSANYNQRGPEWEFPAYMELLEKDLPSPSLSQGIGVRIHGGWTRRLRSKSLRLYARGEYGESRFNHRMFPDQPYDSYNRLILRNSGNDFPNTMFRDASIQAMVAHLDLDVLAYRPFIVMINGEYWGIKNLRERYDKHYLHRVYAVDPENIDVLNLEHGLGVTVREGDREHYNSMINYINSNGLAGDHHYRHIRTLMDVENFTDYNISNIFVYNHDWPGNNTELWRLKTPGYIPGAPKGHDGRWRWLLFDTDYGLGWWNNDVRHNTLEFATATGGTGWPNPDFSTLILRNLLSNESYRNYFINRFADLLNTTFLPERTTAIINHMKSVIEPEMEEHIARWSVPESMDTWDQEVQIMINFLNRRPAIQRGHIRRYFNLSGYTRINLDVSSPLQGHIKINTIDILASTIGVDPDPYPWSGEYFQGVPVELEAIPGPGYLFDRWEGLDNNYERQVSQAFADTSSSITAHFMESTGIHYWHFNSLPGGIITGIETDYSLLPGGGYISYPGTGDGYMDRVSDGSDLNSWGEAGTGYGLRVRNPSDTRELIINSPTNGYRSITLSYATKRTSNGAGMQEIYFRSSDEGPWNKIPATINVTEEWTMHRVSLPSAGVDNNPDLTIRILFQGGQASAESGNNRFDNIRIEGLKARADDGDPAFIPSRTGQYFHIWHSNGAIHLKNPSEENITLNIYNTNGTAMGSYEVTGYGHHTIPFRPASGIYIARLAGTRGVSTEKFLVW